MTELDLLSHRARLAIVRRLRRGSPATAAELATDAGVHLNTARAHLASLVGAGAVERLSEATGRRGRPAIRYRLRSGFFARGEELLPLAGLLADALTGRRGAADLRRRALAWGRARRTDGEEAIQARLAEALRHLGFEARVSADALALSECPCPLVAPDRPELICGVAGAVAEGVLEGSGLRASQAVHDPVGRRCSFPLVRSARTTSQRRKGGGT